MEALSQFSILEDHQLLQRLGEYRQTNVYGSCMLVLKEIENRQLVLNETETSTVRFLKFIDGRVTDALGHFQTDTKDWRVDKMKSKHADVQIRSRHTNNQMHFSIEGHANLELMSAASIIFEADLYPQWVPFCKTGEDVREPGIAEKVSYVEFNLPLLPRKGAYIFGCLVDRLSTDNTILVYLQGATDRKDYEELFGTQFKSRSGKSALQVRFGVIQAELVAPNQFKFKAFVHLDVKFSLYFLPGGLLGFISKKLVGAIIQLLVSKSNAAKGSEWEKRMLSDRKGFYKLISQKGDKMKSGVLYHKL